MCVCPPKLYNTIAWRAEERVSNEVKETNNLRFFKRDPSTLHERTCLHFHIIPATTSVIPNVAKSFYTHSHCMLSVYNGPVQITNTFLKFVNGLAAVTL